MVDDGIDSYTASLDESDYRSHISVTITQNNEILAEFPYKYHQIYVEPLYLPAENGLPLHIVYRDGYPEFPALSVLNSSDAIFTVVGHTTLVSPETLNSSAFLQKYGPVYISSSIPLYNVAFFPDPIPALGDTVLEIPVTIHGNSYTVHMEWIQPEGAGEFTPIYTYLGKLTAADSNIFLTLYPGGNMDIIGRLNCDSTTMFCLYFRYGTLLHGSLAVPGERISIIPLQTGEYLVNTTNPPYLISSSHDLLPSVIPELLELSCRRT